MCPSPVLSLLLVFIQTMKLVVSAFVRLCSELEDSYRREGCSAEEDQTMPITGPKGRVSITLYCIKFLLNNSLSM